MTQTTTLLFGSIGTLVETSDLQRQAFNQAFKEAGLDWEWDVETYKTLLAKSGGQQRIADYADVKVAAVDAAQLHARKTEIFDQNMINDGVKLRPGVADVIKGAQQAGFRLGFVTTTSRANIDAIFAGLNGAITQADFDFIGDAEMVENSKPAPDIYNLAVQTLDVDPQACVVIEDTAVSMRAAVAAGLRGIAFPGAYADADAFDNGSQIERGTLTLNTVVGPDQQTKPAA